ncbi:MAG: hypothetical protein WCK73_08110 [Deltaproteobacteria bacterium]
MNPKLVPAAWVALGVIIAVPATGWFLTSGAREARALAFHPDGTDLKATDVDNALRELSQKLKQVESTQSALQGAAMVQQSELGEMKASSVESDTQMHGKMQSLEARVAEVSSPRRRIEYTDASDTAQVSSSYTLLRNLGTFSKTSAATTVLLTWNTHVDALGEPGTFCDFQLRVDGKPDSERDGGGGRAVVYVPPGTSGGSSPVTVAALFPRVGAGNHTASVWVRGTARECLENYGNFPRNIIVEEGPRAE